MTKMAKIGTWWMITNLQYTKLQTWWLTWHAAVYYLGNSCCIVYDAQTFSVPSRFFRAQEPKAPVTYCDHALSGVRLSSGVCRLSSVRLFTFSTSSPEPLDGFWWNLVWMKYSRSLTSVVVFGQIRPGADPGRGKNRSRGVPFFKKLLLQNGRLQQQTECKAVI